MTPTSFVSIVTLTALGWFAAIEGTSLPRPLPVLPYPPNSYPQPQPPQPPAPASCRVKGSFQLGDSCILVEQSKLRWFEAKRYCRQLGYKLAEITSGTYYFNLITALREKGLSYKSYWLGAARSGTSGKWSWITSYQAIHPTFWTVTIVDGKFVKEPRQNYYRNCGLLDVTRSHFINTEQCTASHGFICEGDLSQEPIATSYNFFSDAEEDEEESSSYLTCPEGWTLWADGGRCYKKNDAQLSYSGAASQCEAQNATLVTITSYEENVVVAGICENVSNSLWIGLSRTDKELFEWTKNEHKLSYANWDEGEPNMGAYETDVCAEISPEDGLWSDDYCVVYKGSICEMEAAGRQYYFY